MRRAFVWRRSGWNVYRRLLKDSPSYRRPLLGLFLLSVVASPLALLVPLPLKIVLDSVVGRKPAGFVAWLVPGDGQPSDATVLGVAVAMVVGVTLLIELHYLANEVLGVRVGERLRLDLRARLFHRAQRLSLAYHDTVGTADSLYRIEHDATAVKFIPVYGVAPIVTAILTLVGMLLVTALIDVELALVALAVSPFLYVATRASTRRLRTMWTDTMALESGARRRAGGARQPAAGEGVRRGEPRAGPLPAALR